MLSEILFLKERLDTQQYYRLYQLHKEVNISTVKLLGIHSALIPMHEETTVL